MTSQPAATGSACRISIAIPAFNADRYLGRLLESLKSQWSEDLEILIVDDASTDGTAKIIRTFLADSSMALQAVFRTQNQGIAATRNELIALCSGEYVWFIDADDVVLPGAVEAIQSALRRWEPDLLMLGFKNLHVQSDELWRLGTRQYNCLAGPFDNIRTDIQRILVELFDAQQLHVWSKIARRSIWASLKFPIGRTYEDIAISPLLVMAATSVVHLNRACIAYRRHPESITAKMSGSRLQDLGCSLQPTVQALRRQPHLVTRELSRSIAIYAARVQATMWKDRSLLHQRDLLTCFPLSDELYKTLKLTPLQLAIHLAIGMRWKTLFRTLTSVLLGSRA